jgi:hypothetical protein
LGSKAGILTDVEQSGLVGWYILLHLNLVNPQWLDPVKNGTDPQHLLEHNKIIHTKFLAPYHLTRLK